MLMTRSDLSTKRRSVLKAVGFGAAMGATGIIGAPAFAQNKPLQIGIIAPRAGVAGTAGECGIRAVQWSVDRLNAANGIGGRKVELVIQEETTPKETIDRFRKLVLQDKVDCVQGVISSGVSLALGPAAEESKTLTLLWDGTTQDGVKEMMPNPKYLFRAIDNEVDAVMASLLAIKHYKGKFTRIAGVNADYTYGRNTWTTFQAMLKKYGIEHTVVSEQWVKVGTMDLTSNVAALKVAKPDLIFSSDEHLIQPI
jgi:branched-chain amino acid transport system substrate-binding protein